LSLGQHEDPFGFVAKARQVRNTVKIWTKIAPNRQNRDRHMDVVRRIGQIRQTDLCKGMHNRKDVFYMPEVLQENKIKFPMVSACNTNYLL